MHIHIHIHTYTCTYRYTYTHNALQLRFPTEFNYKTVTCGHTHSCAIKANGGIVCWGGNAHGQAVRVNITTLYACLCMHVCMCVCVLGRLCTWPRGAWKHCYSVCMSVCVYVFLSMCVFVCMYVCMYVCMCFRVASRTAKWCLIKILCMYVSM